MTQIKRWFARIKFYMIELRKHGFKCTRQQRIEVYYAHRKVGEYYADIVVNNSVILELKAAEALWIEHENQLVNYLRATSCEVGLICVICVPIISL
ncbi:MAG: GxxExxY protein [Bacteroidetes bacterium]|nr:GxxExxY protein [Bacteroidota bacterium]